MNVHFPLEAIFVPIVVTTHRAASTVPVPSVATPWPQMAAAVKVSVSNGNITLPHAHLFQWNRQNFNDFVCFFSRLCPGFFSADVDECLAGTHTCAENQSCFNIQGGFRCLFFECPHNYRRVGETWVPWLCLDWTYVLLHTHTHTRTRTHTQCPDKCSNFLQSDSEQAHDY